MILLGVDPPAEPIQHGNNFSGGGQELVLGLPLAEAEVSAGQMDTVKHAVIQHYLRYLFSERTQLQSSSQLQEAYSIFSSLFSLSPTLS